MGLEPIGLTQRNPIDRRGENRIDRNPGTVMRSEAQAERFQSACLVSSRATK